jgi:nucleolar GTP-binding protein
MKYFDKLSKTTNSDECRRTRKEFYGRVNSLMRKTRKDFDLLHYAAKSLGGLPDIEDRRTIIIAGLPNVGKTSLLAKLTGSKPKIRAYPFTTKGLMIGHSKFDFETIQFIDTPGVLDRPAKKRNPIEQQAIIVLKIIADFIIYVFDVSETSGYTLEKQMKLYREVRDTYKKPIITVVNKIDIEGMRDIKEVKIKHIAVSCETGKGIKTLNSEISNFLKKTKK